MNTSTILFTPRVINPAKAPHSAFIIIIPSPNHVKFPLSFPPRFRAKIPKNPIIQPNILRKDILSLLKNTQANITTVNTLNELRIAARAP